MNNRERIRRRKRNSAIIRAVLLLFIICSYYALFATFWDTPLEKELRKSNATLEAEYNKISERYNTINSVLEKMSEREQNLSQQLFSSQPKNKKPSSKKERSTLFAMTNQELSQQFEDELTKLHNNIDSIGTNFSSLQKRVVADSSKVIYIPSIQPIVNDGLTKLAASFGYKINPFYKTMEFHEGVDFATSEDTQVYATADGIVTKVGSGNKGEGLMVEITHGDNYVTTYSHLNRALVKVKSHVQRGDIIAHSGNGGLSFLPHLHYEVIYKGEAVDPLDYFFSELTPHQWIKVKSSTNDLMQSLD